MPSKNATSCRMIARKSSFFTRNRILRATIAKLVLYSAEKSPCVAITSTYVRIAATNDARSPPTTRSMILPW